jgi:hypothetical protein
MLVIAVNEKHSLIAVAQMFESFYQTPTILRNVSGYYTVGTGGLTGPIKIVPCFNMKVRN